MSQSAVGIIPARWGSTRFPGKPLALISGKPLLQRTIEGARTSQKLAEVIVATDDSRIAELAEACGARAIMTDTELPTGTDRVWQAARQLPMSFDIIVNIQGDEPLIDGGNLDALIDPFTRDSHLQMATLGSSLDAVGLSSIHSPKIVVNCRDEALYFSRFAIPYSRQKPEGEIDAALKHIGIYAYRRSFLETYCSQEPTALEKMEGLEQLRALHLGARIQVVRVKDDSWGVDTPDDVQKIEKILEKRSQEGAGR